MGARLRVALLLAVLAGVGCSDDGAPASTSATEEPRESSTSTAVVVLSDCPERPQGSSPAVFDESQGTYAATIDDFDVQGAVTFDVVQWLSGEEANEAYERETGDSRGVPNDYYIVNEQQALRTAPLASDASLVVLADRATASTLTSVLPHELDRHLDGEYEGATYWLTFADGAITDLCQQYRP
jgi:hypothetical protein